VFFQAGSPSHHPTVRASEGYKTLSSTVMVWQLPGPYLQHSAMVLSWIRPQHCRHYRQGQQYSVARGFSRCAIWNALFATEFAACHRKMQNCPFLLRLLHSRFFRLLFNFTIYNTIKSSHCKLTFMTIVSIMTKLYDYKVKTRKEKEKFSLVDIFPFNALTLFVGRQ